MRNMKKLPLNYLIIRDMSCVIVFESYQFKIKPNVT